MSKFVVITDHKGVQRLCLEDGAPIPAQTKSAVSQTTEQAMNGVCTISVLAYANDEKKCRYLSLNSFVMPGGTVVRCSAVKPYRMQDDEEGIVITAEARLIPSLPYIPNADR